MTAVDPDRIVREVVAAVADPGWHLLYEPAQRQVVPDSVLRWLVASLKPELRRAAFVPIFGPDGKIIGNSGGGSGGGGKPHEGDKSHGKAPHEQAAMLKTYRDARAVGKGHNSAVKIVSDTHGVSKEHVKDHLDMARAAEKEGKKSPAGKPPGAKPTVSTVPPPKPNLSGNPHYEQAIKYGMTPGNARVYTAVMMVDEKQPTSVAAEAAHWNSVEAATGIHPEDIAGQQFEEHAIASAAMSALDSGYDPYEAIGTRFGLDQTSADEVLDNVGIKQDVAKAAAALKPSIVNKAGYDSYKKLGASDDQIRLLLAGKAAYYGYGSDYIKSTYGVTKEEADQHAANAHMVSKAATAAAMGKNPYLAIAGGMSVTKADQQAVYKQYGVHQGIEQHVAGLKNKTGAPPPAPAPAAKYGDTGPGKIQAGEFKPIPGQNGTNAQNLAFHMGMPASKAKLFGALTEAKSLGPANVDTGALAAKYGVAKGDLDIAIQSGYGQVMAFSIKGLHEGYKGQGLKDYIKNHVSYPVSDVTIQSAFKQWALPTDKLGSAKPVSHAKPSAGPKPTAGGPHGPGVPASGVAPKGEVRGLLSDSAGFKEGGVAATNKAAMVWTGLYGSTFKPAENDALERYSGADHHFINGWLRGDYGDSSVPTPIAGLDAAMARSTSGHTTMTVTRGVGHGQFAAALLNLKPGQAYLDPSFASTDHTGSGFSGVKMRITVPPGTRGVKFSDSAGQNPGENEFLIDRHTVYRLDSISPDGTRNFTALQPPLKDKPPPSGKGV